MPSESENKNSKKRQNKIGSRVKFSPETKPENYDDSPILFVMTSVGSIITVITISWMLIVWSFKEC